MKLIIFSILAAIQLFTSLGHAAMTKKEIYVASMENDAQFIECVGNIFFGVANFQRTIVDDLKWEVSNSEYQKVIKSKESLKKASANLSAALVNSDKLLKELSEEKRKKFEFQLTGFKTKVQDLNTRLEKIVGDIDKRNLPKLEEIHQLLTLAIAGTGFGMDISKQNAATKPPQ